MQHCWSGEACYSPYCVPRRASDSNICRQLNRLTTRFNEIRFVADIENPRPSRPMYNPKISLQIGTAVQSHCFVSEEDGQVAKDYATVVKCEIPSGVYAQMSNCDDVAPNIKGVVNLRLN